MNSYRLSCSSQFPLCVIQFPFLGKTGLLFKIGLQKIYKTKYAATRCWENKEEEDIS